MDLTDPHCEDGAVYPSHQSLRGVLKSESKFRDKTCLWPLNMPSSYKFSKENSGTVQLVAGRASAPKKSPMPKEGGGEVGPHNADKLSPCPSHLRSITLISVHIDTSTLELDSCLIRNILTSQAKKLWLHPKDNGTPLKG